MLNGEDIQVISIHGLTKIVLQNIYKNDTIYKNKCHSFLNFKYKNDIIYRF